MPQAFLEVGAGFGGAQDRDTEQFSVGEIRWKKKECKNKIKKNATAKTSSPQKNQKQPRVLVETPHTTHVAYEPAALGRYVDVLAIFPIMRTRWMCSKSPVRRQVAKKPKKCPMNWTHLYLLWMPTH